jgi:hypothetical protein
LHKKAKAAVFRDSRFFLSPRVLYHALRQKVKVCLQKYGKPTAMRG